MNDITKSLTDFFYKISPKIADFCSNDKSDGLSGILFLIFILATIVVPFYFRKTKGDDTLSIEELLPKEKFLKRKMMARLLNGIYLLIHCCSLLLYIFILLLPIFQIKEPLTGSEYSFSIFDHLLFFMRSDIGSPSAIDHLFVFMYFMMCIWSFGAIIASIVMIICSIFSIFFPKRSLKNHYIEYIEKRTFTSYNSAIMIVVLLAFIFLYTLFTSRDILINPFNYLTGLSTWIFIPFLVSIPYLLLCSLTKLFMQEFIDIIDNNYDITKREKWKKRKNWMKNKK